MTQLTVERGDGRYDPEAATIQNMQSRGAVAVRMEAELVREMDRLRPRAKGPVLSGVEMKALVGVGSDGTCTGWGGKTQRCAW